MGRRKTIAIAAGADLPGRNLPYLFAIGVKMDKEAQSLLAEICGRAQRNPQRVDEKGESVLG